MSQAAEVITAPQAHRARPARGMSRIITLIVVVLALSAFPFVLAALTGEPVDTGTPKFWQGMKK